MKSVKVGKCEDVKVGRWEGGKALGVKRKAGNGGQRAMGDGRRCLAGGRMRVLGIRHFVVGLGGKNVNPCKQST